MFRRKVKKNDAISRSNISVAIRGDKYRILNSCKQEIGNEDLLWSNCAILQLQINTHMRSFRNKGYKDKTQLTESI